MKERLLKARDWSEQLADSAFHFRYLLLLMRIDKCSTDDLSSFLTSFDRVFEAWKVEMDGGIGDALEFASPEAFDGVDSITRDYILGLAIAIRSAIIRVFTKEILSRIDARLEPAASLSWLWSTAEKHKVASPKRIAKEMTGACEIARDEVKRKRMRLEFNAAIRSEIQSTKNVTPQTSKKTATVTMMEKVFELPQAAGWSLSEWILETKLKKSTISSCKAYNSGLMKTARKYRQAVGEEEFQKDAWGLDGEKRRS